MKKSSFKCLPDIEGYFQDELKMSDKNLIQGLLYGFSDYFYLHGLVNFYSIGYGLVDKHEFGQPLSNFLIKIIKEKEQLSPNDPCLPKLAECFSNKLRNSKGRVLEYRTFSLISNTLGIVIKVYSSLNFKTFGYLTENMKPTLFLYKEKNNYFLLFPKDYQQVYIDFSFKYSDRGVHHCGHLIREPFVETAYNYYKNNIGCRDCKEKAYKEEINLLQNFINKHPSKIDKNHGNNNNPHVPSNKNPDIINNPQANYRNNFPTCKNCRRQCLDKCQNCSQPCCSKCYSQLCEGCYMKYKNQQAVNNQNKKLLQDKSAIPEILNSGDKEYNPLQYPDPPDIKLKNQVPAIDPNMTTLNQPLDLNKNYQSTLLKFIIVPNSTKNFNLDDLRDALLIEFFNDENMQIMRRFTDYNSIYVNSKKHKLYLSRIYTELADENKFKLALKFAYYNPLNYMFKFLAELALLFNTSICCKINTTIMTFGRFKIESYPIVLDFESNADQVRFLGAKQKKEVTPQEKKKTLGLACGCFINQPNFSTISIKKLQKLLNAPCTTHNKNKSSIEINLALKYYKEVHKSCIICSNINIKPNHCINCSMPYCSGPCSMKEEKLSEEEKQKKICLFCKKSLTKISNGNTIKLLQPTIDLLYTSKKCDFCENKEKGQVSICFICGFINIKNKPENICKTCEVFPAYSNSKCKVCQKKNK